MQKNNLPAIGMVFGVFYGLHPGHRFFLREASLRCQKLIVVVALPEVVEKIKKRIPRHTYQERVAAIASFGDFLIIPSDKETGSWKVFDRHKPDIVFLGYDQLALGQALQEISMPHAFIGSHYPEKYKSGLLNK